MAIASDAKGGVAANAVLIVLASAAVILRFVARGKNKASLQLDDWTILIALIVAIGLCVSAIYAAAAGLHGVPYETMTYRTWMGFRKVLFSDIILCHFIYGIVKVSVILFYKRIFSSSARFKVVANIMLAVNAMFIIAAFFAVLFCARGVSSFWTVTPLEDGTELVLNLSALITSMAVIDIALDLVILLLPMPVIKNLKLSPRKKVSVAGIFLLGGFCLVSSVARLYYAHTLLTYRGRTQRLRELADDNDLWAHIEAYASIFTACLPTLGPILRGFQPLESIIGSIKSLFSLSSRSTSFSARGGYSNKAAASKSAESEKRQWYEMGTKDSPEVSVNAGYDSEAQSQRSDAIMVRHTATSGALRHGA